MEVFHCLHSSNARDAILVSWWSTDIFFIIDNFFLFLGIYIFCFVASTTAVAGRVATNSMEQRSVIGCMVVSTALAVLIEDVLVFFVLFEVMLVVMVLTICGY